MMVSDGKSYFVGATDRAVEGDWRWLNNRTVDEALWFGNEPNNQGGKEHCAVFKPNGKMNDLKCSWDSNFISEKAYS